MRITLQTFLISLAVFICLQNVSSIQAHSLDDVLTGEHRSDKNKARDVSRNPKETLEFFGIKEDMTVVEVWPSAGWYTEILAPYLNESGQYIGQIEPKIGLRLSKLIKGGNKYNATVMSVNQEEVIILIKEIFKHLEDQERYN